ncbi:hypothetical protein MCOR27_011560 [Pyricularia oryzae]|uniref:Uncharacterized protein n=1 Tax=Pyricularia grisea TaxID=148305 RepID=A0ABQ8NW81_PYRGI|nr:hypothetical protein MCOR01_008674 [Pyricularia oryzae]KAI6303056.1 hypothetical protein MCOR33_001655 [Pyricularia grisea]KAH9439329.1 hypothetical protein MCOR02_002890 [Pyricularia oryzae]KAI6256870.1 hypothetical protein MCOR19_006689 [Pyricularia oryzae]KAI6264999.1 hypothetical protein MCOR27_011560 [Pyricularia oryzae]
MAPIGIALIGGGIFIKQAHIPAVLATPSLEVKAVYSRSLKSAKESAALLPNGGEGVDLYSSEEGGGGYADVLKRDDVSGVIIALPIANQPEYIKAALDAGKHVLAEKPVAPNVSQGRELIEYYHSIKARTGATWSCAEQMRCMPNYIFGAAEARKLGKITGFRAIVEFMTKEDNPYYNTEWRKNPTHDYGFILDGGVHWAASLRMLLGDDVAETVSGFSHTASAYLPSPDTLQGIVRTKYGASGAFLVSCGSTLPAKSEFSVACERGSVTVSRDNITVSRTDGSEPQVTIKNSAEGVKYEVQAWAAALEAGKPDPRLAPEEGLADAEFLLGMLKSADAGGVPQNLSLQHV